MQELQHPAIQNCLLALSAARTTQDAATAWMMLGGRFPGMKAIVSLPGMDRDVMPVALREHSDTGECLVPYFSSDRLFFLDDALVRDILLKEGMVFPVDYTVTLDTNAATYVHAFMQGKSGGDGGEKIRGLMEKLLLTDGLNFDHLFYVVENSKVAARARKGGGATRMTFWRALSRKFRRNLVSLQLFCSIDTQAYRARGEIRMLATPRLAVQRAATYAWDSYGKPGATYLPGAGILKQRALLLQVIGMVRIGHTPGGDARTKLRDFVAFSHDTAAVMATREIALAQRFFSSPSSIRLLERIKPGLKGRLIEHLDNTAWDLYAPRLLEELLASGAGTQGRFMVPYIMSFDRGLKESVSGFRVKAVLFDEKTHFFQAVPEPASTAGLHGPEVQGILAHYMTQEAVADRARRRPCDVAEMDRRIAQEYVKLVRLFRALRATRQRRAEQCLESAC